MTEVLLKFFEVALLIFNVLGSVVFISATYDSIENNDAEQAVIHSLFSILFLFGVIAGAIGIVSPPMTIVFK